MFNTRTRKLLSISVFSTVEIGFAMLISLRSGLADPTSQPTTPAVLQPCIRQLNAKHTPIKAAFVNVTYQKGGKTYYFLNLFPPQIELGVRDAIFSSSPSGCQVLSQYPSGDPIPVTALVPLSVARGLTLSLMKSEVSEAGGLQKYQSFLNLAAQDKGKLYLDSNKVWALRQLGIRILPSIKILPPPSEGRAN